MFIGYFVVGLCALRHFGVQGRLGSKPPLMRTTALMQVKWTSQPVVVRTTGNGTLIVMFEDITFEEDPKYFKSGDTNITIEDDKINAAFTMDKTIPTRARGRFTLLGMSMGEYNVPTGLDVEMPLCGMIVEPILMGPIFKAMGVPRGVCPVPTGTYKMEKFEIPVKNLPDEFEENRYLGKLELTVDGKPIMCVKVMAEVMNEYER